MKTSLRSINLKNLWQEPSGSLRIAFWTLITTSGIYWTLALLLGGSLLTSCSGSIFSEEKKPTTPPAQKSAESQPDGRKVTKAPTTKKPNSTAKPPVRVEDDGHPRDTDVVDRSGDRSDSPRPPRGRVINDVETLNIYEILAPAKIGEWTDKMNERQQGDFLSRLGLDIVISKPVAQNEHKKTEVRTVNFYIRKDDQNISRGGDKRAPYASAQVTVSRDTTEADLRNFFANGFLQKRDDGSDTFFALSLRFKKGKKEWTLDSGKFLDYDENGDPGKGYRIDSNTLIRVTIK